MFRINLKFNSLKDVTYWCSCLYETNPSRFGVMDVSVKSIKSAHGFEYQVETNLDEKSCIELAQLEKEVTPDDIDFTYHSYKEYEACRDN